MFFLGRGDWIPAERWCSYSLLKALPTCEVWMDLVHTLYYAVVTLRFLLAFPRRVWPLHRPSPEGSTTSLPCTMDTNGPAEKRTALPPDWKVSLSGVGLMFCVGELNETFTVFMCWRARDWKSDWRCGCAHVVLVSAIPTISAARNLVLDTY